MKTKNILAAALSCTLALTTTTTLFAQNAAADDKAAAAELAKKLANPVAALVSVPIQNNWDFGYGPANATRYTLNLQPVIPFRLTDDWNLITRTIVPFIDAESTGPGVSSKTGFGDIVHSAWLSPKEPTDSGWIWGAGGVLMLPTGTDGLSAHEWGAGPTALVLKQENGWTYGALVNHLWSLKNPRNKPTLYASTGTDAEISATFLQPFVSFTTKTFTTLALNTETTYDWKHEQWTVPVNVMVSQLVKIGGAPVQFSLGYRYYADKPAGGPDWGLRFTVTLLFPK